MKKLLFSLGLLVIVGFSAAVALFGENILYDSQGTTAKTVSPGFASITLTNGFTAKIGSFSGPTNSIDLSLFRQQFTMTTACAVTNISNGPAAGFENSATLTVTNGSGGDLILYLTGTITTDDGARNYTVTNGTHRKFSFNKDDTGVHCVSRTFF